MQNLLRWTKTGFCLLLHTPHFVRSACLTDYNLFQGVLKQVCGVINRVKDITLNRQDCSTDFYFSYTKSNILASTPSQATFKDIAEWITKMWVGRDFWRSSKRIFFSEQDHLLTLDHGSLNFSWKAESIKPPRLEMPQPLWGWKAKALCVMMYSHEKAENVLFMEKIGARGETDSAKQIPWIWSFVSQSRITTGYHRKDPTSLFYCSLVTGQLALKYACSSWYHTNYSLWEQNTILK